MGLHDYGHVNAPKRSNMHNYRVVTMNKMAIVIKREKSTADFQAVLLFTSILKPIRHGPLLLEGYYRGTRRPLDSAGRRECGKCRLLVFVLCGGENDCCTQHVACVGLNTVRVIVKFPLNARTNARCRSYCTPVPVPVERPFV